MRIILLGPPGSGKGTQGDLIEKKYNLPKISTGDLLRQAVQGKTPLGEKAEAQMKRGGLVSDEVVEELVRERISGEDCQRGYVLDGFPRNISQAEILEKIDGKRPEIAIEIKIDEEELVRRLEARRICSQCGAIYNLNLRKPRQQGVCDICKGVLIQREDDTPSVIRERMRIFEEETRKLRDFYIRKRVYYSVDGSEKIETLFGRISSILDTKMGKFKENEVRR